jgi:hypothetical protein
MRLNVYIYPTLTQFCDQQRSVGGWCAPYYDVSVRRSCLEFSDYTTLTAIITSKEILFFFVALKIPQEIE